MKWLLAAVFVPFALYLALVHPDVEFWDTGEMQTVPWIFGIAHPTGFPAFVTAGWIFSHLLPVGNVAWRLNVFSALAMAGAAGVLCAASRELGVRSPIALGGAWLFAASELAVTRGTRTEVHALAILLAALVVYAALRYARRREPRLLIAGGAASGLTLATHPATVFAVAAAAAVAVMTIVGARMRARQAFPLLGGATLAGLAGLSLYAIIPLRSAWLFAHAVDPTLALGVGPGRPFWDYGHPADLAGFLREISGSDFTVGGGLRGLISPASYGALGSGFLTPLAADVGWWAVACATGGFAVLVHRLGAARAAALAAGMFLPVVFALSFTSESDVARYFLPAYWMTGLLAALALDTLASGVAAHFPRRTVTTTTGTLVPSDASPSETPVTAGAAGGTALLRRPAGGGTTVVGETTRTSTPRPSASRSAAIAVACAAVPLFLGAAGEMHRDLTTLAPAGTSGARLFIDRVRSATPKNAIVISNWTTATPLGYAAYVERALDARIVETAWPQDDSVYLPAWTRFRPVVVVDSTGQLPTSVVAARPLDGGWPRLMLVTKTR